MRKILFVNWNLAHIEDIEDILDNEDLKISFTYGIDQTAQIMSHEKIDVVILKNNSSITKEECRKISPNVSFIIANSFKDIDRTLLLKVKTPKF